MREAMLQQPTVEGKVDGFINTDPWQLQCRECGRVDTKPDGRGVAIWVILAGFLFCLIDHVRRCPDCRAEHEKTCMKCARS